MKTNRGWCFISKRPGQARDRRQHARHDNSYKFAKARPTQCLQQFPIASSSPLVCLSVCLFGCLYSDQLTWLPQHYSLCLQHGQPSHNTLLVLKVAGFDQLSNKSEQKLTCTSAVELILIRGFNSRHDITHVHYYSHVEPFLGVGSAVAFATVDLHASVSSIVLTCRYLL